MKYKDAFINKGYKPKSAGIYSSWLEKLERHYPNKSLEEISFKEIKNYMEILDTRLKLSGSSRIQAKKAIEFWFTNILNTEYNFSDIVVKREYKRNNVEFYTEEEILELIASCQTLKARIIISITYGCGLDVSELINIKKLDVDLNNKTIKLSNSGSKRIRYAIIPDSIIEDLKLYIAELKPKKWLFENDRNKEKLSMRGAHWAFQKAVDNSSITKDLDFKSLKYSYIKHLEFNGIPLLSILDELGLNSSSTYYSISIAGVEEKKVSVSPLDFLQIPKANQDFETNALKRQINNIENDDEKEFLMEAVRCLENGAYRAGIIFIWNYAIRTIHHRLLKHSLSSLNTAIKNHYPNAKNIKTEDDFAYIKESIVLKAAQDLGEFDKNQKQVLEKWLDERNFCSHPGKYRPTPTKAMSCIEDVINILIKK